MKNDNEIQKELEEFAPFLSGLERKNPFDVPPGYFDALPGIIQDVCVRPAKKSAWIYFKEFVFRPRFATALAAVLVVYLVYISIPKSIENTEMAVVEIQASDISEDDLLIMIDENTLKEHIPETDEILTDSKSDIENYLIDNNADIANLINSL